MNGSLTNGNGLPASSQANSGGLLEVCIPLDLSSYFRAALILCSFRTSVNILMALT